MEDLREAYSHDPSGYYIGPTLVQRDPFSTEYLLPPNTVLNGPGEIPSGKRAKWNGSTWLMEDIPAPAPPPPPPPRTQEQMEADARVLRNRLLQESDYTQLPDVPISEELRSEYKTYRQELRDVPAQAQFPTVIVWPNEPTYEPYT